MYINTQREKGRTSSNNSGRTSTIKQAQKNYHIRENQRNNLLNITLKNVDREISSMNDNILLQ